MFVAASVDAVEQRNLTDASFPCYGAATGEMRRRSQSLTRLNEIGQHRRRTARLSCSSVPLVTDGCVQHRTLSDGVMSACRRSHEFALQGDCDVNCVTYS